jgi:hypothetical protein
MGAGGSTGVRHSIVSNLSGKGLAEDDGSEENELLLEASHLMEGDTLRIFRFIENQGHDVDTRQGVLAFLASVLDDSSLLPFCERVLLRDRQYREEVSRRSGKESAASGRGTGSNRSSSGEEEEVDGRQIVTGLWNFLSMDKVRLTAFLFSMYEPPPDSRGNLQGLSVSSVDEMVADLGHRRHEQGSGGEFSQGLRQHMAGDRLQWEEFSHAVADSDAFLAPLFESQSKLRAHLLGEDFWTRRESVRAEVLGGAVIASQELGDLGRNSDIMRRRSQSGSRSSGGFGGGRRISTVLMVEGNSKSHNNQRHTLARQQPNHGHQGRPRSSIFAQSFKAVSDFGRGRRSNDSNACSDKEGMGPRKKSINFSLPEEDEVEQNSGSAADGMKAYGGRDTRHLFSRKAAATATAR